MYANRLNLVLTERPVNYLRAGVILFAVYKQRDGVWLASRNAASEDNRFRALCTKACLSYLWGWSSAVSFGLIKTLSLQILSCLKGTHWCRRMYFTIRIYLFCLHCYSCINIMAWMKIPFKMLCASVLNRQEKIQVMKSKVFSAVLQIE